MPTLAGDLRTPDVDAVVSGEISLTPTAQRDAGAGVTLVRITYPIEVTASTYSKAGIPAGEYSVIERLNDDEGMYGTEREYRVVVPDGNGTWSLRALREMYEGPPDPDPDLFLTVPAGDARYATSVSVAGKADLVAGKLNPAQLPDLAIMDYLGDVASQSAMLALTGQKGDWCTRTDTNTDWIITGTNPAQIGSWRARPLPASALTKTEAAASYAPLWQAGEVLTAGARRTLPIARVGTLKASGTTGSSFDATEQALWSYPRLTFTGATTGAPTSDIQGATTGDIYVDSAGTEYTIVSS